MKKIFTVLFSFITTFLFSQSLYVPPELMKLDDGVYYLTEMDTSSSEESRPGQYFDSTATRMEIKDNVITYFDKTSRILSLRYFTEPLSLKIIQNDGMYFCSFMHNEGASCRDNSETILINNSLIILNSSFISCLTSSSKKMVYKRDYHGEISINESSSLPKDFILNGEKSINVYEKMDIDSEIVGKISPWNNGNFPNWHEANDSENNSILNLDEIISFKAVWKEPLYEGMDPVYRWYEIRTDDLTKGYIYIDPLIINTLDYYKRELDMYFNGL